jgi:hypothetical protein
MGLLNNLSGAFGFGGNGGQGSVALPAELSANSGNTTPASGLEPGNGWVYHTFTSASGSFTVNKEGMAQVFAIGGGGGGNGHAGGGGGGAGGCVYDTAATLTTGTYNVTRGGGGGGGPTHTNASSGNDSSVSGPGGTWTGRAGGRGGAYQAGAVGGCAGGNSGASNGIGAADPIADQMTTSNPSSALRFGSNGGGNQDPGNHAGGGGGGIGARGRDRPNNNNAGQGGPGIQFDAFRGPIIGIPALSPFNGGFGGGGGGGGWSGENGTPGGSYGGGAGRISYSNANASSGTQYSGGGGGSGNGPNSNGGSGGDGLVIIRYRKEALQGGTGSSSSDPIRYASDLKKIGVSGTYWFQTRSMGDASQYYVDATIPDGPWIRVYTASTDTNNTDITWPNQYIPGLLMSANQFMYCFVNVNDNSTTQQWSWWFYNGFNEQHYGEFIGNPPQRHGSFAEPLITRVNAKQLSTGNQYNGYYLRTGIASFSQMCDAGRSGTYGQICLKSNNTDGAVGTNVASDGLLDFPHHSAFASPTGDFCSESGESYSTTSCSSTRRFAVYCKLFDQEFAESDLPT